MPRDYDDDDDHPRRRRRKNDDDEERPRVGRKVRRYVDDDDDEDVRPRRRSRPKPKQVNVVGMIAVAIGVISLLISFIPCFASISLFPGIVGVLVGFIGLVIAQRSDGRQGYAAPIAGMSVSVVAILIGVGWLFLGKKVEKELVKIDAQAQADLAKEHAEWKAERARAVAEVKAAANPVRVSAVEFVRAYKQDPRRADVLYKNKVVEVIGVIDEVEFEESPLTYSVILNAGPDDTLNCVFSRDPETRAELSRLKPGATVTVRGLCLGDVALLDPCILVQQ